MRVWAGLLVAAGLAALTGCRVFERWTKGRDDKQAAGEPASRTKDRDDSTRPPRNWLDNPVPPSARETGGDVRSDVKGVLAGMVVDLDGHGVGYLSVQIDLTEPGQNAGAPVSVETDRSGYFVVRGLKPNQSYTLTAQAKHDGKVLVGQSVVRTPSPYVRLQLRDDMALPPKGGIDLPPGGSPAPPATGTPGVPPPLFDTPASRTSA